jgi:putative phosphoribosyl transferase
MNQETLAQLQTEQHLAIVASTTRLFEEPGALEAVARLTKQWFKQHL